MPAKVAFIGLGVMGYPMAGHLVAAGLDVTVYNRTSSKARRWQKQHKGKTAKTPREAAKAADIVMACVGNDDDIRAVTLGADGAFSGMAKGQIFVDHTTASADVAREMAAAGKRLGVGFVDAPVSGGQAGAENGQLTIMCGGAKGHFNKGATLYMLGRYGEALACFERVLELEPTHEKAAKNAESCRKKAAQEAAAHEVSAQPAAPDDEPGAAPEGDSSDEFQEFI